VAPSDPVVEDLADQLQVPLDERDNAKDSSVGIKPFLEADQDALLAVN